MFRAPLNLPSMTRVPIPPEIHLGPPGLHGHSDNPRPSLATEIIAPVACHLPFIILLVVLIVGVGEVQGRLVGAHDRTLVDSDPDPDEGAHAADQSSNLTPRGGRDEVVAARVDGAADRVLEAGDGHVGRRGRGARVRSGRGGRGGAVGADPNVTVDAQDHVDLAATVAGTHGPDLPPRSHHPAASSARTADS